jgi:hypothetical protein
MGKSYIKYKDFGFWSRDTFIESWLLTLLAEMRKSANAEPWQKALMVHRRTQAPIDGGCMWVGLDDFLADKSKEESILSVAKQALPSAEPLGRETGELFIKLLEGRLRTNESIAQLTTCIGPINLEAGRAPSLRFGISEKSSRSECF